MRSGKDGQMPFRDRYEAGQLLAKALRGYRRQRPVILALPRGGVPVAVPVARELGASLDLLIVRKIGLPSQPELAMGAVADGIAPLVVRNENVIRMAGVSEAAFAAVRDEELAEIDRRRKLYVAQRPFPQLKGRTVIIIDDGIATGATMKAALQAVRMQAPRRLVLAVPVAAAGTLADLHSHADAIVCLEAPAALGAIGAFYAAFDQVSDDEVIKTLASFSTHHASAQLAQNG